MSTNRIRHSLSEMNVKSRVKQFYENNKHSKQQPLEKAIELLSVLVPIPDKLTTHRLKMHRTMINMIESCLDPYYKEYGIEIGIAFTLKSGSFGKTIITDWGDVFISIPANTLSKLRTKLKSEQTEDLKTAYEIDEHGSNLNAKSLIRKFKDRPLSEKETEKFIKTLGLYCNSETTISDKKMAKSVFGQSSNTAKMRKCN